MDYIFYRVYKDKIKSNQPPILGAFVFLSICLMSLMFPVIANVSYLLGLKNTINKLFYCFSFGVLFLSIYYTYVYNNKYLKIIKKYDSMNSRMEPPLWVLELAYPICVVIGISLWGGIYRFIIQEYNLEGKLGELILSIFK